MKYLAIFLTLLALALGSLTVYELVNTQLQVTGQDRQTQDASEQMDEYNLLKTAVLHKSLEGTTFSDEVPEANLCRFDTYTVRLKNNGLLPVEMVEIQLSQEDGDILYYGSGSEVTIAPGETKDVWVKLLTGGNDIAARDMYITYYIWGHPQTEKFTYSGK